MKLRSLLFIALSLVVVLSCGKDDGPTSPPAENNAPDYGENKSVTVSAGIPDTHIIGTYTATDADEDDELTYSISTNSNGIFKINATTGQLSLASGKTLDPEDSPYTITLTVSDGTATDSMELTITATAVDPDNTAPTITVDQVFAKPENSPGDIAPVVAGDDDEDPLTYTLNTDTELFVIDANSGVLSLAEGVTLDYEYKDANEVPIKSYVLSVTVSDGQGGMATENVTVNVTDVNEAPVFGQEAYTFEVEENIDYNHIIGTILATDPEGEGLAFSITDDSGLFGIDAATGALSLIQGQSLDYEALESPTIELVVSVSEDTKNGDENTSNVNVTINVLNLIENLQEDPEAFLITMVATNGELGLGFVVDTGNFDYDFEIDWGDNTESEILTNGDIQDNIVAHVYPEAGEYQIGIKGNFPFFSFNLLETADNVYGLQRWGSIVWESFAYTFKGCQYMEYFAEDVPDLSAAPDMTEMFSGATSFVGGNLQEWNVSLIENMNGMFINTPFNEDVSGWEVTNVVNMARMFENAGDFDQDLGGWDISNVEVMNFMLDGTNLSVSNFDNTLIGWAAQNVVGNVALGAEGLTYCSEQAIVAVASLEQNEWIIDFGDGGLGEGCPD